jgi:hypothetical protein
MTDPDTPTIIKSLRETAPRLNKKTDEVNEAIRAAEEFLRETSLGIEAGVPLWATERTKLRSPDADDEPSNRVRYTTYQTLAYRRYSSRVGRGGGEFRIVLAEEDILDETDHRGFAVKVEDDDSVSVTPLAECNRQEKIRAVAALPNLLRQIYDEALRLEKDAGEATKAVHDVLLSLKK